MGIDKNPYITNLNIDLDVSTIIPKLFGPDALQLTLRLLITSLSINLRKGFTFQKICIFCRSYLANKLGCLEFSYSRAETYLVK